MKKIRYYDRNQEVLMPVDKRTKTFEEYALGYTINLAIDEARRCILCKDADKRCIKGCPINVDIPGFISKIAEGNILEAYKIITQTDIFPSICGRVCPQERQCEGACILYFDTVRNKRNKGLPVNIGALEKFVGDFVRISGIEPSIEIEEKKGYKVAIVGSGPASLGCAYELARRGVDVEVYEALPKLGGVMFYGIPNARLDKSILEYEINKLKKMGVKFHTGIVIGRSISLKELKENFDAVFIGVGAGRGNLGIKGDNLINVYSAIEFLMNIALGCPMADIKKVAIIGGGFTAVDCAISAIRFGIETHVVYRRTRETSSARDEEWDHIQEEGAIIHWLTQPKEIIGDENGYARGLLCVRMELGEPDESGRPRPIEIPNSEFVIDCDAVVLAIGQKPNPVAFEELNLKTTKWGTLEVDQNYMCSVEGIFASGDVVNGGDTVVRALKEGKEAAKHIYDYLINKPRRS